MTPGTDPPLGFPVARPGTNTNQFHRLQLGPTTALGPGELPETERHRIEVLDTAPTHIPRSHRERFIPVYYLAEDEDAAIELFVDLNKHRIDDLDIQRDNHLSKGLPRDRYIRVLAVADRLRVRRFELVVMETRESGTTWLIGPKIYDNHPDRRYTPGDRVAPVPPAVSLHDLYHTAGETLTRPDVEQTAIEGDLGMVLRYYTCAEQYPGHPHRTPAGDVVLTTTSPEPTEAPRWSTRHAATKQPRERPTTRVPRGPGLTRTGCPVRGGATRGER